MTRRARRALLVLGTVVVPAVLAYAVLRPTPEAGAARPAAVPVRAAAPLDSATPAVAPTPPPPEPTPAERAAAAAARARADRLARAAARAAFERDTGLRVLVSLADRRLWVLDGRDTVRTAPVGIGMDSTLVYRGRVWNFRTPRGLRRVLDKEAEPVWVPPDWHYVEVARARGLRLRHLAMDRPVALPDGSQILVQGDEVGLVRPGEPFTPFARDEEIIWEGTLYVPPLGTRQRAVSGELGRYRLDLGDGYLLHGTPHTESVGRPSSHGCMRLGDEDIAWLFEHVPVGTRVLTD